MSRRFSTSFDIKDYFTKLKTAFQLISIRFYLLHRTFRVKYGEVVIQLKEINSGVPQGNILRLVFYLLYTADLPVFLNSTIAIYANDTVT